VFGDHKAQQLITDVFTYLKISIPLSNIPNSFDNQTIEFVEVKSEINTL
jgi:hypothetical protein